MNGNQVRPVLLGPSSPNPLWDRQGPAALTTYGEQHVLFDAGRGVTTQLIRVDVAPLEV